MSLCFFGGRWSASAGLGSPAASAGELLDSLQEFVRVRVLLAVGRVERAGGGSGANATAEELATDTREAYAAGVNGDRGELRAFALPCWRVRVSSNISSRRTGCPVRANRPAIVGTASARVRATATEAGVVRLLTNNALRLLPLVCHTHQPTVASAGFRGGNAADTVRARASHHRSLSLLLRQIMSNRNFAENAHTINASPSPSICKRPSATQEWPSSTTNSLVKAQSSL
jgi:hypothetical protein